MINITRFSDFSFDERMLKGRTSDELGLFLIDSVRSGLLLDGASKILKRDPNLGVIEPRTGFTAFHIAAAVGRRDLFDLFRQYAAPNFALKDLRGRTMGDLAAIVAQDYELVEHIYEVEARSSTQKPSP